ncbi:MAG: hypothetical protein ACRYFK_02470 [Janthinobacterium lividum]
MSLSFFKLSNYHTGNATSRLRGSLSLLLLLAAIAGCKSRVENNLIKQINQNCGTQAKLKCQVALKDATPFRWDRLYLFGAWTTSDAIKEKIGLDYQGADVQDDYRRMLFIQGGKVVHEEDFHPFDYQNSTVDFSDLIDSLSQAKTPFFTPDNALFIADKGKIEQSCQDCFFYSLSVSPAVREGVVLPEKQRL